MQDMKYGKVMTKNILLLKIIFVLLIAFGVESCNTQKNKNAVSPKESNLSIQVNLNREGVKSLLTIQREGEALTWTGDTIAIISWWNARGEEQSQSVSGINGWEIKQEGIGNDGHTLICCQPKLGFLFKVNLKVKGDILDLSVLSSEIIESGKNKLKSIRILPYFGAAKEGDKGYLALPKDVGVLCYFKDKEPASYDVPVYAFNKCNMPLFGMIKNDGGFAGIITGGQFDAKVRVNTNSCGKGIYSIEPIFVLRSFVQGKRLEDDINVQYHFLAKEQADWMGIAKTYKNYNTVYRNILPLKERVKSSPELAYSAQALEVRIRMGVKPVPTPVVEQTPENEPAVRVFLTFKQLRDIFDEFHRQGIEHSEFCIVGWHSGGHDGRFPQLFPVEEAFGGEEELRKTIIHGQSLGYQIVSHDCYQDAYRISEDWNEKYIRKTPDGELMKGPQYAGGQVYLPCRERMYELFAKRDLPKVRDLGFKGVHYNDVLSIAAPTPCYDPRHPETKRQDAEASNKILALSKKIFGGVQSEGPLDFTAPILDRVLYISIFSKGSALDLPYVDELVPLYSAVYHGTLLYNIWNNCVNTQPGDEYYLKNIEYGGMPVAYYYGHFWLDPGRNWLGDSDLHYDNKEGLQKSVFGLKKVYDDLQKLKHLQMKFIEGHEKLAEGVFETLYSNGESVIVNYNETPYVITSGVEVPARGFKVVSKNK